MCLSMAFVKSVVRVSHATSIGKIPLAMPTLSGHSLKYKVARLQQEIGCDYLHTFAFSKRPLTFSNCMLLMREHFKGTLLLRCNKCHKSLMPVTKLEYRVGMRGHCIPIFDPIHSTPPSPPPPPPMHNCFLLHALV